LYVYDSQTWRIVAYSIGQSVPVVLMARQLLQAQGDRVNPGTRLAGILAVLLMVMFVFRILGTLTGFDFNVAHSGP
ncbi:hypothetical protein ABTK05_22470, partial [Acinetobacter baumannii]